MRRWTLRVSRSNKTLAKQKKARCCQRAFRLTDLPSYCGAAVWAPAAPSVGPLVLAGL